MSFGRVRAIARKELWSILRDPRSLGVTLVLPVVLLALFGYAINFDVRHISLAVYDPRPTTTSRDLLESLTATEYFDIVSYLASPNEADEVLARGRAQAVLVLPTRFAEDLAACPDRRRIFLTSAGVLPPPVSFDKARRTVEAFKTL